MARGSVSTWRSTAPTGVGAIDVFSAAVTHREVVRPAGRGRRQATTKLWGLTWRVRRYRCCAGAADRGRNRGTEVRTGRKPGTRVNEPAQRATCGVHTLLLERNRKAEA